MKKYSLGALVAAGLLVGGLTAGSASAADLGGNCCADLEERIAELEATTARKGNRKVSLTISGWVAEQVMWWDDGSRAERLRRRPRHHAGLATSSSPVRRRSRQAGMLVTCCTSKPIGSETAADDQPEHARRPGSVLVGGGTDSVNGVSVLQSFWFIKSDHLGKVSVGLQSQASDNTAILVDGSGSLVPANWVAFDYARSTSAATTCWRQFWAAASCRHLWRRIGDCNGFHAERRPLQLADLRRVLGVGLLGRGRHLGRRGSLCG